MRLLRNTTYMACVLGSCADLASFMGYFTFAAKYIETQFGVSASFAPMVLGMWQLLILLSVWPHHLRIKIERSSPWHVNDECHGIVMKSLVCFYPKVPSTEYFWNFVVKRYFCDLVCIIYELLGFILNQISDWLHQTFLQL